MKNKGQKTIKAHVLSNTISLSKFMNSEYTNDLIFTFFFYFDDEIRRFQWRAGNCYQYIDTTWKNT